MPMMVIANKKATMAPVRTVGSVRSSFKLAPQRLQKLRPGVIGVPQVGQNIDLPSTYHRKSPIEETAGAAGKFLPFWVILGNPGLKPATARSLSQKSVQSQELLMKQDMLSPGIDRAPVPPGCVLFALRGARITIQKHGVD